MDRKQRIALISTGGTIEKTYDELHGVLDNRTSVLDVVLATLQLDGVEIVRVPLMNKDSLEMTPQDHELIARTAGSMAEAHDGVVIVPADLAQEATDRARRIQEVDRPSRRDGYRKLGLPFDETIA